MRLELRQLTHLLAVADKGSFGKAADSLGISQPALTKSIRNLEAALQVKLLERLPRGVSATVYGEAIIARARTLRLQMDYLLNDLRSLQTGIGGVVKVGLAQGLAGRIGPLAALRVAHDHPNLRFSVKTGIVDRLVALLLAGEIEFAITPFGRQSYGPNVVEEFLFYDRPLIVVRHGHPLTRHTQLVPRQVIDCQWVLGGVETPLRRAFDQVFVSEGLLPPTPVMESDLNIFTKTVLMQTDFVSFFPRDETWVEESAQLLTGIPLRTIAPPRSIGILRRRSETLSPFGELLAAAVRAVCRDLGYIELPKARFKVQSSAAQLSSVT